MATPWSAAPPERRTRPPAKQNPQVVLALVALLVLILGSMLIYVLVRANTQSHTPAALEDKIPRTTEGKALNVADAPAITNVEGITPDEGVPKLGEYRKTGGAGEDGYTKPAFVKGILGPSEVIIEVGAISAGEVATWDVTMTRKLRSQKWAAKDGIEIYVKGLDTKQMVDGQEIPQTLLIYIGPYRTKDGRTLQGYSVSPPSMGRVP